ncbi:MAG TPA: carboxypeptidase-like regulatory domain-containing protein [Candidatus Paceibacterota bacterium]|nr:carboxypeptidase-like regulatory domain-containing protein [Candidatus Paceibacterota bacterium]
MQRSARARGVTLIDTLIGIALMLVVFAGISEVFVISIDVVTNAKARIGALALANDRMEYLRSLAYLSVGTEGGIPAGNVPQDETIELNGVTYLRHAFIRYVDLPQDGTGAADENGITEDAKQAEVTVSWDDHGRARSMTLTSLFAPPGMESTVPGGTLEIVITDASSTPLPGASVHIVNASTTPAIDLVAASDADGEVELPGAPASSGYDITVAKDGYSSAQTYAASAALPNPSPGALTVAQGKTTSATFVIDRTGTLTIHTYKQIAAESWEDSFADDSGVATSSGMAIGDGVVTLASGTAAGSLTAKAVAPAHLAGWTSASWEDTQPAGTAIRYHLYAGSTLVPDSVLPGNVSGFAASPIDLSGIATSTYPSLALAADFTGSTTTSPSLTHWQIAYEEGPDPLPDIGYTLTGEKTIGLDADGAAVAKYSRSAATDAAGTDELDQMEFDTYDLAVTATGTYDVAESCPPTPFALTPGAALDAAVYLADHTADSLLVDVRGSSGVLLPGVALTLTQGASQWTATTDSCGQAFFPGIPAGSAYGIVAAASGYQQYTESGITVGSGSRLSIVLSQ